MSEIIPFPARASSPCSGPTRVPLPSPVPAPDPFAFGTRPADMVVVLGAEQDALEAWYSACPADDPKSDKIGELVCAIADRIAAAITPPRPPALPCMSASCGDCCRILIGANPTINSPTT